MAYCLNSLFYIGLFFIPMGFILNKLLPNQEKIFFDKEGIITSGFFHIKKKHLYDDIVDIYLEDSPTRCNVYGLLENDKFLVGLSLNHENAEHLMNVVKAVVTLEGNIEQTQQEKTS